MGPSMNKEEQRATGPPIGHWRREPSMPTGLLMMEVPWSCASPSPIERSHRGLMVIDTFDTFLHRSHRSHRDSHISHRYTPLHSTP